MLNHYTFDTKARLLEKWLGGVYTFARKLLSSLGNIKKGITEIISGIIKEINSLAENISMKNGLAETIIQILKIIFN